MDIIRLFVAADGIHIRIEAFSLLETVFLKRIAFPLCKGMDNFGFRIILFLDAKGYRAFYAI